MSVRSVFHISRHLFTRLRRECANAKRLVELHATNPGAQIGVGVEVIGTPEKFQIGNGSQIHDGALLDFRCGGALILGENVTVQSGAVLSPYGGEIRIGNHSGINHYTILYGHGGLNIGDYVRIAAHCLIIPANHGISRLDIPISHQPLTKVGITICNDVWIGAHAVILDGVKIGRGAVIAAGSVVTSVVEPQTVSAGIPAKTVRVRKP